MFYQKEKSIQHVNEARQEMFCQKEKSTERLPPTQDALMQHTKCAAYQAGIWCTSDQIEQHVPSPEYWGWTLAEDTWIPVWTKLPIAAQVCSELIKYGSRCACKRQGGIVVNSVAVPVRKQADLAI